MNTQPEALRLADELERYHGEYPTCTESAAELRRLHAQRDAVLEALKAVEPLLASKVRKKVSVVIKTVEETK